MCIYKIYFKSNLFDFYIGSTIDYKKRISRHKYQLNTNKHNNTYLQNLYNKRGKSEFISEIIEEVKTSTMLIEREQYYIDELKPTINILKKAYSTLNYRHTNDAKEKIKKANKGRKMTEEQIRKGVLARVGQKTCKGCKRTDAQKQHLSKIKKKKVLYMNKVYESLEDLSIDTNIKYQTLYAMITNRNTNKLNIIFYGA